MRLILLVVTLMTYQQVLAADSKPSYQQMVDQYIETSSREKSPFSASDMAVMQKAGQTLASSMPDPGIKVGEKAPMFVLNNAFGKSVSLATELDKGAVVLVFYRGAWCPFCNMHLNALQKVLPQIKALGAQLIAVTPQTPDRSAAQVEDKGYPFEVLSDLDSRVMKDYQLYFELPENLLSVYRKHGLDIEAFNGKGRAVLPVPGTFIIDSSGVVRAMQAETDYKKRMEPADILTALEKISAE